MTDKTVWIKKVDGDGVYVPRCSHCGKFGKELRAHWFFTGLYCYHCIVDVLWGGYKKLEDFK
jgi:hypothetical protein